MKTTDVTDRLQDWQKQITEKARDVGEATDSYIRENMWSSIAFAAIAGCVLGFLLGRSRD